MMMPDAGVRYGPTVGFVGSTQRTGTKPVGPISEADWIAIGWPLAVSPLIVAGPHSYT